MKPNFNTFIPAVVIDDDAPVLASEELLVSLPAIPRKGDTIVVEIEDGGGDQIAGIVTDVAYIAQESSKTTLKAYVQIFVSYTKTRAQVEAGEAN